MVDTPATQQQMSPEQANQFCRDLIIAKSQMCTLQLPSQVLTAAQIAAGQTQMSFTGQNVGLVKGFWCQIAFEVTNTGGSVGNLTGRGAFNVVQRFQYYDLLYNNRIDTSGFYISLLDSAKIGWGFGGTYAANLPNGIGGNNFPVNQGATTIIATTGDNLCNVFYYIPLAYSATDTTGAVFAQTTGGTQSLVITINPTPGYTTNDSLYAIYGGTGTVVTYKTGTSVTANVWQDYWGQLPNVRDDKTGELTYLVPTLDIGTSYDLKQTVQAGPTVGTQFPLQVPNYRKMLSIIAIFDNFNSGAPNGEAAFGTGTDISNWLLQAANYTPIRSWTPGLLNVQNRNTLLGDMPKGSYLFDFRSMPLDAAVYGNIQITMTPAVVNSAVAYVYYGFEALADSAVVTQAGSYPAR